MPKNSLLDGEFIDDEADVSFEDDTDDSASEEEDSGKFFSEGTEIDLSDKPEKQKGKPDKAAHDIDIDIVDDTPEEDRGKWVADDDRDGEPDFPSEDEMKKYSRDVQQRIKKMTARTHAERRRAEEYQRQLDEAHKFAKTLLEQQKQLSSVVQNGEKVLIGEHKGRLEAQLASARQAYREAHEAGDTDGVIAAQELISRTVSQLDRLSTYKPQPMREVSEAELEAAFGRNRPQQQGPTERDLEWRQKNRWFGHDQMMTAYAMAVHSNLVQQEGIRPTDPDYYERIDGEMRKRFPEKFGGTKQSGRRRTPPVSGANRSSGTGGKKVVLTQSQVALAKRLGITPEQYARELVKQTQK